MLETLILPIAIVTAVGLIAALILAVASKVMAVKVDETVQTIRAELPGANCGACGYAGCDEYAAHVADGSADTNLCVPGGASVAQKVSAIMGKEFGGVEEKYAHVKCRGHLGTTDYKMEFEGPQTCQACSKFFNGRTSCTYGCMGYGDCVEACKYDAIHIIDGVAVVDKEACVGCGACAKACPKGLIEITKKKIDVSVACSSKDKGGVARKLCTNACIGCKKCEKVCPKGAITVENNVAHIDESKCVNCHLCFNECPTGAIISYKKNPQIGK